MINPPQIYIIMAIVFLLIVALLVFFINGRKRDAKISPLTGIAFAFIIAGMIFGEERLIGYSLLGIGIIIAIVDMLIKLRKDGN